MKFVEPRYKAGDKFILHSSNGFDYTITIENVNNCRPPDEVYATTSCGPAGTHPDILFYGDDFFDKYSTIIEYVGNVNDDYEGEEEIS